MLKEATVWPGKNLKVMTQLVLTIDSLHWRSVKKEFHIEIRLIIGCVISQSMSRSFSLMAFDEKKNKFEIHDFLTISLQQAKEWCDLITNHAHKTEKKICFLVNPISGSGNSRKVLEKKVIPVLAYIPHIYDVFTTTHPQFIDEFISRRDFSVYTDVVCLGGDGTMQQTLNAIHKYQPNLLGILKFGIVPVGSRNALSCELTGKNLNLTIFYIAKSLSFTGDLMQVSINNEVFLATTAISWGLVSDICDEAQHLRKFGAQRYNIVALKKLFQKWKHYAGVITFEDSLSQMVSFQSDYIAVSVGNHRVPNSHNQEILMPGARINNGKLELMMMFNTGKFKTIATFMKMQKKGAHVNCKNVNFTQSNLVTIEPKDLMVFNVDGEIHYTSKITVKILPQAINYIGRITA